MAYDGGERAWLIAQPNPMAFVTKLTSHNDQGGPVSVRATVTRSVRSALIFVEVIQRDDKEFRLCIVARLDRLVCGVEAPQSSVGLRVRLTARDWMSGRAFRLWAPIPGLTAASSGFQPRSRCPI